MYLFIFGGDEMYVHKSNGRLMSTGSSYTTTFSISCAFYYSKNNEVKPCPIHITIVKGYSNSRYVYQFVPVYNYAVLNVYGSANPRTGPTPEELLSEGAVECLDINANGRVAKAFIEVAEANDGIIAKIFEDMCHKVPGRFCYYPIHAEELPLIKTRIYNIRDFLNTIKRMDYPYIKPTWFRGGEIKAGWITPTRQGNLIGTSKIKAPCWVNDFKNYEDSIVRTDILEISGNEDNKHKVHFTSKVEVLQDGRSALVHSDDPIEFMITHPQHETVHGKMQGLVQFVHLRSRWE